MDQNSKLPMHDDGSEDPSQNEEEIGRGKIVEEHVAVVDEDTKKELEEEDNCKTPTSSESKLISSSNPAVLCCPNAPKKQRSNYASVANRCKRRLSDFDLISLDSEQLEKAFGPRRREFQPESSKKRKCNSC